MPALAFDTHAFVKELTAAGFSETQAEAVTSVVRRSQEGEVAGLATRADVAMLKADIAMVDTRIAESKSDILKWVAGMVGFQTLAVLGAVLAAIRFIRP